MIVVNELLQDGIILMNELLQDGIVMSELLQYWMILINEWTTAGWNDSNTWTTTGWNDTPMNKEILKSWFKLQLSKKSGLLRTALASLSIYEIY